MSLDELEESLKIIVVGDGNVGKTSMLRRYVKGNYTEQYKKTIGAEYLEKQVFLKDLKQSATLMLWDTAGQEVFGALTSTYFRGAAGCVLAFSTIDRDSFMNVINWKKKVEAQCGTSIVMVLCQTKYDLAATEAAMTKEEAEQLAGHLKLPFYRISTKDDFNVTALFEFVAKQCMVKGTGGNEAAVASISAPNTSAAAAAASSSGDADKKDKDKKGKKDKDKKSKKRGSDSDSGSDSGDDDDKSKKSKKGKDEKDKDKKDKDGDKKEKEDKDKKDKKDKDKKDDDGPNTKPITLKEVDKKKKKEKKESKCVV